MVDIIEEIKENIEEGEKAVEEILEKGEEIVEEIVEKVEEKLKKEPEGKISKDVSEEKPKEEKKVEEKKVEIKEEPEKPKEEKKASEQVLAEKTSTPEEKPVETPQEEKKTEEQTQEEEKVEEVKEPEKPKEEKKEAIKVKEKPKKTEATISVENLPISTKYSSAICKFIKNKKIEHAISDLEQVLKLKKSVPMKGEIPHRKGKGAMSGKFPKKSTSHFIILLKSLSKNSSYNGLENPTIVEAIANIGSRPYGRFGRVRKKRTHVKITARDKKIKEKKEVKG